MFRKMLSFAAILAVSLLTVSTGHAVSTLSLASSGDSAYQLVGVGLEGVAGFDFTISYDPAILAAPQSTQGPLLSGAMVASNPNTPGLLRISAVTISAVKGSGQLFTIAFTRKADGQGIKNLAARLIDLNGKPLTTQVQLALGSGTSGGSGASDPGTRRDASSGSGSAQTGAGATGPVIGVVVPPAAEKPTPQEDRSRTAEPEPVRTETVASPPPPLIAKAYSGPEMKSKTIYTQQSVLDGFRDLKGERTMTAYRKLFDQEPLIGFRQEPSVALADGTGTVTVRFISTPERERTSDLALMGAKLLSSRRDPQSTNTWIVTVLPEKGSDRVTLSVPQKELLMVCPLTVAPKVDIDLDRSGTVNEADFELFCRERGTQKAPKFDLNRDGVRDYRDEYTFMANYLATQAGSVVR